MTTLGQRIQALRKEAGLSQEALGEALHVSRQAVSKWEGDGGVPELDTLIQMSRLFHVRLETLLGLEPAPEEAAPEAEKSAEEPAETPAFSPDAEQRLEALLQRYSQQQAAPAARFPVGQKSPPWRLPQAFCWRSFGFPPPTIKGCGESWPMCGIAFPRWKHP